MDCKKILQKGSQKRLQKGSKTKKRLFSSSSFSSSFSSSSKKLTTWLFIEIGNNDSGGRHGPVGFHGMTWTLKHRDHIIYFYQTYHENISEWEWEAVIDKYKRYYIVWYNTCIWYNSSCMTSLSELVLHSMHGHGSKWSWCMVMSCSPQSKVNTCD